MRSESIRVLVVGQTPPPYHGQSVMIQQLLDAPLEGISISFVRMAFSSRIEEIGHPSFGKLVHLAGLVCRVVIEQLRSRASILYYPPANADRVPMLRDMVFLFCTRWLFRRTVFHFHACGLSSMRDSLSSPMRKIFDLAFGEPDLAIHLSDRYPMDGESLRAKRCVVIPNGIPDRNPNGKSAGSDSTRVRILSLGAQAEHKGTLVLLEACRLLRDQGLSFELELVGQYYPASFRDEVTAFLAKHQLADYVHMAGTRVGSDKEAAYLSSDIFCFPSHTPTESFGLVLLEAMQYGLPIVATRWRAVPDIVVDGESGWLVSARDASAMAERLSQLIRDEALRQRFGQNGRAVFVSRFTDRAWRDRMAQAFQELPPP